MNTLVFEFYGANARKVDEETTKYVLENVEQHEYLYQEDGYLVDKVGDYYAVSKEEQNVDLSRAMTGLEKMIIPRLITQAKRLDSISE